MTATKGDATNIRTIAIWGPHGSPGKSTIAINLAESLANSGHRVLLVDADLQNPSLAILLGLDRPSRGPFSDEGQVNFRELKPTATNYISKVVTGTKHFHLMLGMSGTSRWSEIGIGEMQRLMRQMQQYERIIFDLASPVEDTDTRQAGTSDQNQLTRFLIGSVDQLVVVCRPDFLAVQRLVARMLEIKKLRKDKPTRVVFNQVAGLPSVVEALEAFESLAREPVSATISRDDRTISFAIRSGKPARMVRRSAKFVSDIDALARHLLTP
ncbi:MAG: ParA family protein [Microbacteriaceae bacterium]|nr:ParA family protein [Microbacteriaceae bacterium]